MERKIRVSYHIPLAISSGRDLLVRARTGSGKTLAYCIPVLQRILVRKILVAERGDADEDDEEQQQGGRGTSSSSVGGVILVPTRELCDQVSRVLDDLSYYCADVCQGCDSIVINTIRWWSEWW
jgi:ATP-dependent RNA helicase DDX56/DBP9